MSLLVNTPLWETRIRGRGNKMLISAFGGLLLDQDSALIRRSQGVGGKTKGGWAQTQSRGGNV